MEVPAQMNVQTIRIFHHKIRIFDTTS